jgi:pyruvyl transferase EpsO
MIHNEWRNSLVTSLRETIDHDYVLLDCAYYRNVGDVLLWQAALDLLAEIPSKCRYSCSIETFMPRRVPREAIIVLTGGGNFGDLWVRHQQFRHRILKEFPSHKIVQLPQSVWFEDESYMQSDIKVFNRHQGEIVIYLRDEQSFNIIKNNYPNVDARLMPDLALTFNAEKFCKKHRIKMTAGEKTLLLKRNDKELSPKSPAPKTDHISDWSCMEVPIPAYSKYKSLMDLLERRHIGVRIRKATSDLYWKHILKDEILQSGISFLMPYKTIISTRLHGAILAALLGKEVVLIDNSYGKSSGVYQLWMKEWSNIEMAP